jgi:hypothetical protein
MGKTLSRAAVPTSRKIYVAFLDIKILLPMFVNSSIMPRFVVYFCHGLFLHKLESFMV